MIPVSIKIQVIREGSMAKENELQTSSNIAEQLQNDEITIDLIDFFYRLLENLKFVVFSSIFCALAAYFISYFLISPLYTATAKLYVLNAKDSAINLSDLQLGNYLAADFQEVFSNRIVHERVIENLKLDYEPQDIEKMIQVSNPQNTRLLYITATTKFAKESMLIANEYAAVAREFIAATMDMDQPNFFEDAVLPKRPSSPNRTKNAIIGLIFGLFASCAIIFIRYVMDDKIRTSDDIEKYIGLPTLGMLPLSKAKLKSKNHYSSDLCD